ncbi:MAG: hypothetical protein A2W19_03845 [Spirochaetes bacterium RBG_16_49_21]|nr:MAG: hypothetical protein A2W19_03845 [Spirochaetes bacterium RBG_16_49_21]
MQKREKLDKYEKELLESFEAGEWHSRGTIKDETKRYQLYAKAQLKKDRRINIRISAKDLADIQRRAVLEGIPYQTLISSIIHKYNAGRLAEKKM